MSVPVQSSADVEPAPLAPAAVLSTPVMPAAMQASGWTIAIGDASLWPSAINLTVPASFAARHSQSRETPTYADAWPSPEVFASVIGTSASRAVAALSPDPAHAATGPVERGEPFGLLTFRTPHGPLWTKWRKVEAEIGAAAPAMAHCRGNIRHCSASAARFVAIVKQAAAREGKDRLALANRRINASIRYQTDEAQWHKPDVWSAPLDVNGKGSFDTGLGDCEDYAIAKYVALRAAGVAAEDLQLLMVRDTSARTDHAVLAARDGGKWLLLDNRWSRLIDDEDAAFFVPLFALNDDGVRSFAAGETAQARNETGKRVTQTKTESSRTGKISG